MVKTKPILFCDFDGTLCHDRYWRSLPPDEHKKVQELLFRNDTTLVNDWMRGRYSAEEINQFVSEKTGMPFKKLWGIFVDDCKTMQVSKKLLERLHCLRSRYAVILITGNMDSFSRFTQPALMLENYFDCISNSFYENIHKKDNRGEIFLKYAERYNVPIQNCILFDDSEGVCKVFTELGGTAYLVDSDQNFFSQLKNLSSRP